MLVRILGIGIVELRCYYTHSAKRSDSFAGGLASVGVKKCLSLGEIKIDVRSDTPVG